MKPLLVFALVTCLAAPVAADDVFVLANGGRVSGRLENPDEVPRQSYAIRTADGGLLTLGKEQVSRVVPQSPRDVEYERIRGDYPDTVAGQWALAEWCREQKLTDARKVHLRRIVEIEPDHRAARLGLGHTLQNGRWVTQSEIKTARGYKLYQGHWRLPQEIEQLQRRGKDNKAEKDWFAKLKRWRTWLDDGRADDALAGLNAINDPFATKALAAALGREPNEQVRLLYLDALGRIGTPEARSLLIDVSLHDVAEEVRLSAIERLAETNDENLVTAYVAGLRHKDNLIVNRSAVALSRIGDTAAVPALVDALVTNHKFKVTQGSPGGGMSAMFQRPDKNGNIPPAPAGVPSGGGLSVGSKVTIVNQPLRNPAVHDALVQLARVNFDYDVGSWKAWLATQKVPESLSSRRDEAAP